MANPLKSVAQNVAGEFFVDSTCIDCDTCRQLAPECFGEASESAYVWRQPDHAAIRRQALQALVACPTGSIGCRGAADAKAALDDFPMLIEEPVYYCGFNSPKSYGGNSYFIRRRDGNWLVDSPKYLPRLVRRLEAWGGIANIFLTHRDDVADADRYASRFGSRRFIHRAELEFQPGAEVVLDDRASQELAPGIAAIATSGHTAGHCALLVDGRFLFTGDHLHWNRGQQRLGASRDYCWDSWARQTESVRRLADYRFEWILPGHGQRVHLPAAEMRRQVLELADRMRQGEG